MCLKSTFDSTTNHLNLSPMFQNCLLLDLTVIDLMSIVQLHMDEVWVEIANNFEMRTSGGRGSTPLDEGGGGRGGQKRANFCGRPLWMAPYDCALRRSRGSRGLVTPLPSK